MPRLPIALLALSATTLLGPACSDPELSPLRHDERMRAWLEYAKAEELPGRMQQAAQLKLNVNLRVSKGVHGKDYVAAACRAAEENDVALRLWPLLPEAEGYWANQSNAEAFVEWVEEIVDWVPEVCPRLDGFEIDAEMPITRAQELQAKLAGGASSMDVVVFMIGGIDKEAFEAARKDFKGLVEDLHDLGLRVAVTGAPFIADDWADGDQTMAKALWTPIEGIPWDGASFQIYRSVFDQHFSQALKDPTQRFTAGLVTTYAESIRKKWGDLAGIDLGSTGTGIGLESGMASAAELQADIAAALAAGIPAGRIAVYSLEGLDGKPDAAEWVKIPSPAPAPVDPASAEIRGLFADLDSLTD